MFSLKVLTISASVRFKFIKLFNENTITLFLLQNLIKIIFKFLCITSYLSYFTYLLFNPLCNKSITASSFPNLS